MEYYLIKNNKKIGPFTKEQVKENNITHETLVWTPGTNDWKPASEFAELRSIFKTTPPLPPIKEPRFWMKRCVLTTILCPPLGIIGVINSIKAEEYYHRGMHSLAEKRAEDARKWALWGLCIFSIVSLMTISLFVSLIAFKIILT
mgnify:CR=1 FL=1